MDNRPMDATEFDWRTTFKPDDRQKFVNKIMDSVKKQLPASVYSLEGLGEIATTFEEKMYTTAASQSDYLRKISMTLLAMETKPQTTDTVNTKQSNSDVGAADTTNTKQSNSDGGAADTTNTKQSNSDGGVAQKPPNPASQSMQSQELNQGQSRISLLNQQSQAQQQRMSQAQQQRLFQATQQAVSSWNVRNGTIPDIPSTGAQRIASQSMQSEGQSRIPLLNQQSQAQQRMSQAQQHLFQAKRQRLFQAQQQAVSPWNVRNGTIPNIPSTGAQSFASLLSPLPSVGPVGSSISQSLPPNVFSGNLLTRGMLAPQQIAPQQQQQQSQNPQLLHLQQWQLEQQIQHFQAYQQYINQQMHHLQQQQQQLSQQQQIPQLQQQFQQLTLQQQSVQLNGGAYNIPTTATTPQFFQVTSPFETSHQQHSSFSSPQIHDQQHQKQEKQQPLLPISLPKTIPPLQSEC